MEPLEQEIIDQKLEKLRNNLRKWNYPKIEEFYYNSVLEAIKGQSYIVALSIVDENMIS